MKARQKQKIVQFGVIKPTSRGKLCLTPEIWPNMDNWIRYPFKLVLCIIKKESIT